MDVDPTLKADLELFRRAMRVMNLLQYQQDTTQERPAPPSSSRRPRPALNLHLPGQPSDDVQSGNVNKAIAADNDLAVDDFNDSDEDDDEEEGGDEGDEEDDDDDDDDDDEINYDYDHDEDKNEGNEDEDEDEDEYDSDSDSDSDEEFEYFQEEAQPQSHAQHNPPSPKNAASAESSHQHQHPPQHRPLAILPTATFSSPSSTRPMQPAAQPNPAKRSARDMNQEGSDDAADLRCWEHGCNGRRFTTRSNLRRHLREKSRARPTCQCPRCGAVFSRTTARNTHMIRGSCHRIRRYSNGRARPHAKLEAHDLE